MTAQVVMRGHWPRSDTNLRRTYAPGAPTLFNCYASCSRFHLLLSHILFFAVASATRRDKPRKALMAEPGSSKLPPSVDHEQQPGPSPLTASAQDLSNEATTQRPEGVSGASTIGRSAEAHEERSEKLEASRDAGGFSQDAFDDYGDGGAWKVQQRKHNQTRPEKDTLPEAFVLVVKPRVNVALTTVLSKDLHRNFVTATSAAVNTRPLTYALQPASNTIRLLVYDKRQADGLLKLSQLDVNRGQIPVQVYQAPGRDMCRGVIYNVDCNETKTELRAALTCEHRRILDARPMGKRGTCLLTFEGRHPPNTVVYYGRITRVSIYEPKSIVCKRCHRFGHKKDVCPNEAVCPTCGKTHEESSAGDECKQTTPKCRNCEEEGHTATDPKCPAKLKSDANLAKKIRSRPRSRSKRHGVHRSRSLRTTVQPHDVKSTQHRLEDENVSTQPLTLNCAQPTARGSGCNLNYAAALKQTRPSASKPANVSHYTTPMPPSPSQLVDPSKDSAEAEVAELARQNAELRRKLEENEKRHAALLERLRSKRQQQPCNPQEPTKTQKPASTTITQQTDLALLVQQILHPLLQAQEQHFQRQYGFLQQLFASRQ
ncbi:hypothetical protein HPB49_013440 [Dermacentor silvarum]|uniref:Uncharacterized protein n=1 Tax=Dermacentor silvarum TaxID=543639 RepID=A0ACB8C9Q7_DERSI|nr:hypothetical protein HPB49_013440 [Dermacentor silvarum]